jgi:hypothetical protein
MRFTGTLSTGTLSTTCDEMSRNVRNSEIQLKHINSLFPLLERESDLSLFARAFQCIFIASKENPQDHAIQSQVLIFLDTVIQSPGMQNRLETTNIWTILMNIIRAQKDQSDLSEIALRVTSQAIAIPKIGPRFTSPAFVESLEHIARHNPKSENHSLYTCSIFKSQFERNERFMRNFCNSVTRFSQNRKGPNGIVCRIFAHFKSENHARIEWNCHSTISVNCG